MDILTEFPFLIPVDKSGNHYDGYLNVGSLPHMPANKQHALKPESSGAGLLGHHYEKKSYRLEIIVPAPGKLSEASVNCDSKLRQILSGYSNIIQQRLSQCGNLLQFLKEVRSIVEQQLGEDEDQQGDGQVTSSRLCSRLVADIEQIGFDRLLSIAPSFDCLKLQEIDTAGRSHILSMRISTQYPAVPPQCSAEVPGTFEAHWTNKSCLLDVFQQFRQTVAKYQEFWDMMADIDKHTWVLEPDKPTYSAVHRRIAISPSASLQITVDPSHPGVLPECRFLGADQAVTPLRQSMNSNIHLWREDKGLLENLQLLLAITLPSPDNSRKEEFSMECGICYSYRLELEIPEEVCNDKRCGQAYHNLCLYEWLRNLPSSRQSFNTIFGECPYCEKAMTVKMKGK